MLFSTCHRSRINAVNKFKGLLLAATLLAAPYSAHAQPTNLPLSNIPIPFGMPGFSSSTALLNLSSVPGITAFPGVLHAYGLNLPITASM